MIALFPIKIHNKTSFILILNIDAKAAADHNPVVGNGTPTNIINPIILAAFSFLAPPSIFLSTHLISLLKYLLFLR